MLFNTILICFILILYFLLHLQKKESKFADKLFLIIVFIIFTFIVGFRDYGIGNDTNMYLDVFNRCATQKWDAFVIGGYYEPGYLLLNILISYISSSSRFFMIFMSILFNTVVFLFIKKESKNYLLSVLMYVCFLMFYTSMTMMRQFCAMLIVLSSFGFAKNRKIGKFLLSVIIASFFHSTAWIALLIYPMVNLKHSKKFALICICISIIACLMIGPITNMFSQLIGRTNFYTARVGSQNLANILNTFVFGLMYLFSYILCNKDENINVNNHKYLNTGLFTFCLNLIAINMNVLSRVADYFLIFTFVAFPNIIENNVIVKKKKTLIVVLLIILLYAYSSTIIVLRPEWNSAFRYTTSFFTDNSFFENYR